MEYLQAFLVGGALCVLAQVLIDNQDEIRYIGLCYQHWREGRSHA